MIDPKLRGRNVLITGANSGIGAAAALAFARHGAAVAVHYLDADPSADVSYHREHTVRGREAAEDVADNIRQHGVDACLIAGDLMKDATPEALFAAVEAELGPVDVLVNNAAHCYSLPLIPSFRSSRWAQ